MDKVAARMIDSLTFIKPLHFHRGQNQNLAGLTYSSPFRFITACACRGGTRLGWGGGGAFEQSLSFASKNLKMAFLRGEKLFLEIDHIGYLK
jgi:hypothetical protein